MMKKALSLLLSLLMLVSLLAVPVSAGADDGFNDGQFGSWGDDEPVDPPVDPDVPVEPDEPALGTKENPYHVSKPASFPTSLELEAGACVYYQFPALKFNGWTITGFALTGIEVDGVMNTEISMIDRAVKITLSPDGNLVGFYNESEEAVTAILTLEEPLGTSESPYQLEEGVNEIEIPEIHYEFYAEYTTTVVGEYTFAVSNFADFEVLFDADRYDETNELLTLTEDLTIELDSGIPVAYILRPINGVFTSTLTVTAPAKGTETNPYYLYDYAQMQAGVEDAGDAMWPATLDGVHYTVDGWSFEKTTLLVTGTAPLTVTVNGKVWSSSDEEGVEVTLEIPLTLGEEEYAFKTSICSSADVKLDAVFPLGTENNPHNLNTGANTIYLPDTGETVFITYTAEKDGVLLINPHTVNGVGRIDATNQTEKEDGTFDSDFIYAGWYDDDGTLVGASDDNVLTIPVKKGDVVQVLACAGENEDFEIIAMDLNLYVCYEADHKMSAATCTKASTCSACGLTVGGKAGHKYSDACDTSCNTCGATRSVTHSYKTVTKKATTKANGYTVKRCSVCAKETGKKTLYQVTSITLSKTSYTYNGKVQKPTVTVKNAAGTKLTEGTSYTVSYASGCKTAGTYKVTVTLKGNYEGTVTKTFKINPIDVSKCTVTLSKTSYTYNGKVQKPTVTVKNASGTKLTEGGSYTVTYASGCKSAGTYKVTIKMKGNYTGTVTKTFKIAPQDVSKCKITLSATSYTYNGAVKKPTVTVKNAAGTKLTLNGSYTVTYASGRKNVGTYKVTIKMKGNYTGTKTLTFKINPAKTSISKITAASKKLTVKWAKKTTQVTGYEIQYSTSKTFASSVKTKTITKNSTVSAALTGLKAKTTYYVRVRTYKTVNGVKYYSGWTTVKSLKTK